MPVEPSRHDEQPPTPSISKQQSVSSRTRLRLLDEMFAFLQLLSFRAILRWSLVATLLYGLWWLISSASSALVPFIVGIILAYLLLPLVNRLERTMPRWVAIIAVYLVGLVVIGSLIGYVVPLLITQVAQLLDLIPSFDQLERQIGQLLDQYQRTIASIPPQVREPLDRGLNEALATVQSNLADYAQNIGTFLLNSVLQVVLTVTSTVGFLIGFVLIPFWLFYVLMDQKAGSEALNRLIPRQLRADFWAVATIIDRVLNSYIRGQIFLGFVVGSAAGLGLFVLGLFGFRVDYILLLAVIAGFTELIPVIGPIIGAIPAIVLGFIDSPTTGLAVTILYIAIQQLENHLLVPRIVGDSVDIHPAILMVLLVVCSQVFGLWGAILSAPLAAVVRDVFSYLYGRLSEPPIPAGVLPKRHQATPAATEPPAPQPDKKPLPEIKTPPIEQGKRPAKK